MNMLLQRRSYTTDGVFGSLVNTEGEETVYFSTLEHAYSVPEGHPVPKIPMGTYTCQRGPHRLHSMTEDFETFEITNVPGHTNVLFHWGNYNKDSDGCVLLGMAREQDMIIRSKEAFLEFMQLHAGEDSFELEIRNA